MSKYATETDFKNVRGIDTSKLLAKSDLVSLKAEVDKLDMDKLVAIPLDLIKLSKIWCFKKNCVWYISCKSK